MSKDKAVESRNASSSSFGWAFQVGAGIVLMLRNIKEFTAIRMEGEYDDIEISFDDGKIFAQAKSVVKMGDRRNASRNLSNALQTLKDDVKNNLCDIKSLIYITNIQNPLSSSFVECFSYGRMYSFEILPEDAQETIRNQLPDDFPFNKFKLFMLDFYGDGHDKFSYVKSKIEEFLRDSIDDPSYSVRILESWFEQLFVNGTDKPNGQKTITLSKPEIIMPIISSVIDCPVSEKSFSNVGDSDNYSIIRNEYKKIVRAYDFNYEFITTVMSDFLLEKSENNAAGDFKYTFVSSNWQKYEKFFISVKRQSIREDLIKMTLLSIIEKRAMISDIKEAANLK